MAVPLFRTSLLRSTQFLNGTFRNVSRTLGIVNRNLLQAPIVLPSYSALVPSRNLMTTSAAMATAAQTASAKRSTTAKGRTLAKKPTGKEGSAKKPTAKKKQELAAKKRVAAKKRMAARKKLAKAKAKKAKESKVHKKDWSPPFKRPLNSWARFATEFAKTRTSGQPIVFVDQLRAASLEWKNMSEEQKDAYASPATEIAEYSRKLAEWNANLPSRIRRARRRYRKAARVRSPMPLTPIAQYVKEQFHQVNYPAEVTTTPRKMAHLSHLFANALSEADKAGLKLRSWEEFTKKNAGST